MTATPATPVTLSSAGTDARRRAPAVPLLLRQLRAELRLNLRAPEFVVPVIALPLLLYVIFGAPRATEAIDGQATAGTVGLYTMVGFAIYGVLNVVLFAIGESIAGERGRGWLRLVRTTPLPSWAHLAAKLALAAVLSGVIVLLLGVVGTVTGVPVTLERWLAVTGVLVIGGLAIAPLGFLIGFAVPAGAASAVALLLLFPLSLASGVFLPVDELPGIVRDVSVLTPTFHLAELAREVAGFGRVDLVVHAAWLAGWCLLGLVAVGLTYRRMVGRQFA